VSYPEDRLLIRDLIENWALYRDSGDWERFASLWHDGARMNATWFQGPYEDFIEASRKGAAEGVQISHFLGGMTIDVQKARAVAQTKMTISQRGLVHDVLVDVVCAGRFYDFLERRDGRWGIVRRQPIYEIDRMDPVDPAAALRLDAAVLGAYPEGYRHLAYLQRGLGFDVKAGLPGRTGAAVEQLYAQGRAWLGGHPSLFGNQEPLISNGRGRLRTVSQPRACRRLTPARARKIR
jgi:SnoaL-like domain